MSMLGGRVPKGLEEVGQTVASYHSYERAQKAVSTLIAADVRARDIAIVGQGLRSVERVTGRLGYAAAARTGAINGLLLGLLFSAVLVIGSPSVPIQAFVGVLFVGIAIGMLLSIVTYSFVRRRRDYASVMQVLADHYEIAVAPSSAARAREVLGPGGSATVAPAGVVGAGGAAGSHGGSGRAASGSGASAPVSAGDAASPVAPPRYGERLPVDTGSSRDAASDAQGREHSDAGGAEPSAESDGSVSDGDGSPRDGAPVDDTPVDDTPVDDTPVDDNRPPSR